MAETYKEMLSEVSHHLNLSPGSHRVPAFFLFVHCCAKSAEKEKKTLCYLQIQFGLCGQCSDDGF